MLSTATKAKRLTQRERLRELLLTGHWYSNAYLSEHIGLRFGARLLELRRGTDNHLPMEVEVRHINEARNLVEYRFTGHGIAPKPVEKRRAVIAALRAENAALRQRLASLEVGR